MAVSDDQGADGTRRAGATGIGGVFFKASDPQAIGRWYRDHLGVELEDPSGEGGASECTAMFRWRDADDPERIGTTVWAAFPRDTPYFSPGDAPFMINYRVEDLDGLLERLRAEGVWVDEHRENHEYGRFAWIRDPDGNRIELWEPPADG